MRKLVVTAEHFDRFLFRFVAEGTSASDEEFETSIRLIRKLKDPAITIANDLSKEELAAQQAGSAVYPFYRLRERSAVFFLEEDEWKLAVKRLEARKRTVWTIAAEDFLALIEALNKAPVHEVMGEHGVAKAAALE